MRKNTLFFNENNECNRTFSQRPPKSKIESNYFLANLQKQATNLLAIETIIITVSPAFLYEVSVNMSETVFGSSRNGPITINAKEKYISMLIPIEINAIFSFRRHVRTRDITM